MRAIKKSHSAATTPHMEPHALQEAAASRANPNARDHLGLSALCAMSRKTMSAPQRLLLVQLLVQSFTAATRYVPADAKRLLIAAELPPVLERVAEHIQRNKQTWFAWTDNRRTWFLVAEMATDHDQHSSAALRILFYDEDGECVAAGTWAFHADGNWTLLSL